MVSDLFIGNLDRALVSADLESLFSSYPSVQRAQVINDKTTGQSKGFGFVTFGNPAEAEEAIAALNGHELNGRAISVSPSRGKDAAASAPRTNRVESIPGVKELFVSGLDHSLTSDDLQNLFTPLGTVLKAKVITDRETRQSRGIGFVQLSSNEENQSAIAALDGKPVKGRNLSVSEARERIEGGSTNGGGFSRHRGSSSSGSYRGTTNTRTNTGNRW